MALMPRFKSGDSGPVTLKCFQHLHQLNEIVYNINVCLKIIKIIIAKRKSDHKTDKNLRVNVYKKY